MHKYLILILLILWPVISRSQECQDFLTDTSFTHSSISFYVANAADGETIIDFNREKSLVPASILKLIVSGIALELLGPEYLFHTSIGYTGTISKSGVLSGNIVIKGGGDPAFASKNFPGYYNDFPEKWISGIKNLGIKKIKGKVITDDSYFDYNPVPATWLWEDIGNYYGAGAFGASIFDNTYEIHLKPSLLSPGVLIMGINPPECSLELDNWLVAAGTTDKGYVFSAPYGNSGFLTGSIPVNNDDFILKASINDPPLFFSKIIDEKLRAEGIKIKGKPSSVRIEKENPAGQLNIISSIDSPPLDSIIVIMNHESVNLYAEHILKELGKKFRDIGSTAAGLDVEREFLKKSGLDFGGIFLADGSGLSRANSVDAGTLTSFLRYMKNNGKYFTAYLNSLPEAGREGTLKRNFKDETFNRVLKVKSGSMSRIKSYSGYISTKSGNTLVFTMIINNFTCPPARVNQLFEEVVRDLILNK